MCMLLLFDLHLSCDVCVKLKKGKNATFKHSLTHVSQTGLIKSGLCVFSDQGRSGGPAYYLIRPLWQPSSLVRSSPTECQRGGMMMYLSDVSVFTLLTLLFFSLLFLPICWGRVSHQSWTSRMLTVCVPATEHCFVSSARNKPKRDLVDSPPASPYYTCWFVWHTIVLVAFFFSYVSEASCAKTK